MKSIVLLIIISFLIGCDAINRTVEENFIQIRNPKEKCEETPCIDTMCLHWDDTLQRCGTDFALAKERIRKKREIAYMYDAVKDSVEIKQLEPINNYLELRDSSTKEILNHLKEHKERMDSIYYQIRINNFCRYLKNTSLLMKAKNTFCKNDGQCKK